MPDPVEVVIELSSAGPETEAVSAENGESHQELEADSQAQSVSAVEPDPVADAVSTAVEQWIGFDPAIHARNPDGSPRLRVDGSYARKRGSGGRKSLPAGDDVSRETGSDLFSGVEQESHVPRETPATAATPSPTAPAPSLSSREAAAAIVITTTAILSKVVGPEWQAEKTEVKALTDATKTYIDAKGGLQMSPEMGLFLAVSMYAAPRFAHENTRSKFSRAMDWCRDRLDVLRARFKRGLK